MNPSHFAVELAQELTLRGIPHDLAHVDSWVRSCWPWIEYDPCPARWAGEYVAATGAAVAVVA